MKKLGFLSSTLASATALLVIANMAPARAAYTVNIVQSGGDVVATGDGTFDFRDLAFVDFADPLAVGINPSTAYFAGGNQSPIGAAEGFGDRYTMVTGPTSFGTGGYTAASSTSGTVAGINGGVSEVILPGGYPVNGTLFPSTTTWTGATIASLGLAPGKYVWTWGDAHPDSFTLNIAGVPEPTTWSMMITGFDLIGSALRRRGRIGVRLA